MRVRVRPGPAVALWALVALGSSACAVRSAADRLYPGLAPYAGREVHSVRFENAGVFSPDTLLQVVQTRPSRCSFLALPLCVPLTHLGEQKRFLDPTAVAGDVQRLETYYRIGGFFGTRVQPEVAPVPGDTDDVSVAFRIEPGDSVVLDSLTLVGLDTVLDPAAVARALPSQPHRRFNLAAFAASADSLNGMLHSRGHAYARVLRNYPVDTLTARGTAELDALPGPLVHIDSIVVQGAEHLSRTGVLRQLAFRHGDLLLASKLVESQRNLYSLDIVQIATVSLAPDSMEEVPRDSSQATVVVRIVEAPEHQVEAAVGWGQIDCFRTEGSWVDRSFGGGARRLSMNASVGKIGIGQGLGGSLCPAFRTDTLGSRLDYRVDTELTQPYFLSPRNHLTATAYAERQSEPSVFTRTDRGGSFSVSHLVGTREFLTLSLNGEQGQTLASPVLFCSALLVCEATAIQQATQYRWLNRVSANYTLDRTDFPANPRSGFTLRSTMDWAAPWLLSSSHFVRWTGEADHYTPVGSGAVLAAAVRFGTFFQTAGLSPRNNFLPPEERFYAGGANTVRGFDRNQLGPGVWFRTIDTTRTATGVRVDTSGPTYIPTGGTALGVVNLELRTPSPILPQDLSLAWFVDAGAVGPKQLWQLGGWRFTPGVGVRAGTPVGPFRLDVAYNPYPPNEGPLYEATGTGLVRVAPSFRPASSSFLGRLHFTLAVGQAF